MSLKTWAATILATVLGLGIAEQSHASLVGDTFYLTLKSQPSTIGAPELVIANLLPISLPKLFSSFNTSIDVVPFGETDTIRWRFSIYASSRSINFYVDDNNDIGPVDLGLVTFELTDLRDQITKLSFDSRFVVPNSIDYSVPHTLTTRAQYGTLALGDSKGTFSTIVVPESSTLLLTSLAGFGCGGILVVRKRMSKRTA